MNHLVVPGFILTVIAGVLAGGCTAPIKLLRRYRFEHWAFAAALTGQVVLPWALLWTLCPGFGGAFRSVPWQTLLLANVFSLAWGVANVLCGLCLMRIGFSLAVGLLTGIGLPIGVLLPIVLRGTGQFAEAPGLATPSGMLLLAGVGIMTVAVVFVAKAGFGRDTASGKVPAADDKNFRGGLIMAAVAGFLQVGLSFAFVYTQGPISAALTTRGASAFTAGIGIWAVTLPGGALVNLGYPAWLLTRNRSWSVFPAAPRELLFSILIGIMFFLFIIGMGTGMRWLGALGASIGFGVLQGAQISTSQVVGFVSGEWHGVTGPPRRQMVWGIALLLVAVVVIAAGRAVG